MAFSKYSTLRNLNDTTELWDIRVRAQAIWKGITRQNGEFRGYNIIFFDDSVTKLYLSTIPYNYLHVIYVLILKII